MQLLHTKMKQNGTRLSRGLIHTYSGVLQNRWQDQGGSRCPYHQTILPMDAMIMRHHRESADATLLLRVTLSVLMKTQCRKAYRLTSPLVAYLTGAKGHCR